MDLLSGRTRSFACAVWSSSVKRVLTVRFLSLPVQQMLDVVPRIRPANAIGENDRACSQYMGGKCTRLGQLGDKWRGDAAVAVGAESVRQLSYPQLVKFRHIGVGLKCVACCAEQDIDLEALKMIVSCLHSMISESWKTFQCGQCEWGAGFRQLCKVLMIQPPDQKGMTGSASIFNNHQKSLRPHTPV